MDPKVWGQNWPAQYDGYLKTSLPTTTKYGGRGLGASDAGPAEQKLDREPWLRRIFAGYAFAIDYRDRRGHAYALFDQEQTRRVTEKKQPGACLQCHASNLALYRFVGQGRRHRRASSRSPACRTPRRANMKDDEGQPLIQHPLACVDCHDPKTMALRVTRPGFIAGIKALKAKQGHRRLRPEPRRHPPGDALVRLRPVPRRVLLQGRRQGRHVSVGQRPQGRGDRGVLRQARASPTGRTPRRGPRC